MAKWSQNPVATAYIQAQCKGINVTLYWLVKHFYIFFLLQYDGPCILDPLRQNNVALYHDYCW